MMIFGLDRERLLPVNDAASRAIVPAAANSEANDPQPAAFDADYIDRRRPCGATSKHVRADGRLIDLAIYSRHLVYGAGLRCCSR